MYLVLYRPCFIFVFLRKDVKVKKKFYVGQQALETCRAKRKEVEKNSLQLSFHVRNSVTNIMFECFLSLHTSDLAQYMLRL